MSESTPPPVQPTPPPAYEPAPEPAAQPSGKKRSGLVIAAVAVLVVLALVGATIGVLALVGKDSHTITTPASAGGMKREADKEAGLKTQLDAAEEQFKKQAKTVSYVKSAIYGQTDAKRGPEGSLVFLGAKLKKPQDPAAFVKAFGKQAGANGFKITNVSAGDAGGKAVCASQVEGTQKIAICAWATEDSMGELIPTVPGWEAKSLTKVMLDLRNDVEKSS